MKFCFRKTHFGNAFLKVDFGTFQERFSSSQDVLCTDFFDYFFPMFKCKKAKAFIANLVYIFSSARACSINSYKMLVHTCTCWLIISGAIFEFGH